MVPDGLETPVFVTEIAQSSGKQSFDQLQSCSRQLEHLNNWLQEGVRNRLVGQVVVAEFFVRDLLWTERLAKCSTIFTVNIYTQY